MSPLARAYLLLLRGSVPAGRRRAVAGRGHGEPELSLSLFASVAVFKAVCAVERLVLWLWRTRPRRAAPAAGRLEA